MNGKFTLAILVMFSIAIGFLWCSIMIPDDAIETGEQPTPNAPQQSAAPKPATAEPEITLSIDADRLFDLAYEKDPQLIAIAEQANKTPACLIAIAKFRMYGAPDPHDVCAAVETVPAVDLDDHPYNHLNDEELRALATSSAEASMLLARRSLDAAEAGRLYEQATALSGDPAPLGEWLNYRFDGGMVHENDELDVAKAMIGYEIALTMNKFEDMHDVVKAFEVALLDAGVDLDPIRTKADARYARLTALHRDLTGYATWEQQS